MKGGPTSTSTIMKGHPKWMKLYKKLAQPLHLAANAALSHQSVASVAVTGSGRQNVSLLRHWRGNTNELLGSIMFSDINNALTASVPPPAAASPNQFNTRRFMINSVTTEHRIKNQTTTPVKITLYDIVSRRDQDGALNVGPLNDWTAGLANESISLPIAPADTNSLGYTQVGITPFQSKQFTAKWRVKNVNTFMLDAGLEHTHFIKMKIGGMFDHERVIGQDVLRGLTHYTIMVTVGGLVQDGATNTVSTSSTTIDQVTTTRVVARMLEKSTVGKVQWNELAQLEQGVQQVVNEETDVITTVQTL